MSFVLDQDSSKFRQTSFITQCNQSNHDTCQTSSCRDLVLLATPFVPSTDSLVDLDPRRRVVDADRLVIQDAVGIDKRVEDVAEAMAGLRRAGMVYSTSSCPSSLVPRPPLSLITPFRLLRTAISVADLRLHSVDNAVDLFFDDIVTLDTLLANSLEFPPSATNPLSNVNFILFPVPFTRFSPIDSVNLLSSERTFVSSHNASTASKAFRFGDRKVARGVGGMKLNPPGSFGAGEKRLRGREEGMGRIEVHSFMTVFVKGDSSTDFKLFAMHSTDSWAGAGIGVGVAIGAGSGECSASAVLVDLE